MNSLIPSNRSGRRLLLTFITAVLSASSALAAEPVPDTQELARQFILGKSVSAPAGSASVPGDIRVDTQAYVRQFILGTPNIELVADSGDSITRSRSAPASAHVDSQERVRQFILGLVKPGDPSRGA